jgi:hypothetical protein
MNATAKNYAELASRAIDRAGMLARIFPAAAADTVLAALIHWNADAAFYEGSRFTMSEKITANVKEKHGGFFLSFFLPALIHAILSYLLEAYRNDKYAARINQLHADLTR